MLSQSGMEGRERGRGEGGLVYFLQMPIVSSYNQQLSPILPL